MQSVIFSPFALQDFSADESFSPIVIKIHLRMFIACVLNIKQRVLDSKRVREKGGSKNAPSAT